MGGYFRIFLKIRGKKFFLFSWRVRYLLVGSGVGKLLFFYYFLVLGIFFFILVFILGLT